MKNEVSKPAGILFVCATNISLSPLMAGIFRNDVLVAGFAERFIVSSAGTHPGKSPRAVDRKIREVAAARGVLLEDARSREISRADIANHDLVVVMNDDCFWFVKALAPEIESTKVRLLLEFSGQLGLREMPDPLLGEIEYETAFETLSAVSKPLLNACLKSFEIQYSR